MGKGYCSSGKGKLEGYLIPTRRVGYAEKRCGEAVVLMAEKSDGVKEEGETWAVAEPRGGQTGHRPPLA